jgi:iron complex outermembrane receptor protein
VSFFNTTLAANQTLFVNLPKARNYGVEVETIWQPIDHLQILANYSYLNAKVREGCCYQDPEDPRGVVPGADLAGNATPLPPTGSLNQDLKGQTLPSSTPHRFTINGNYTWELDPGSVSASLTYVWRDATYYSVFNRYYNKAKSYGQTDARVLFNEKNGKFTAIGYVKNVFDTRGSRASAAPAHHRPEHRLREPDGVLRPAATYGGGAAVPLLGPAFRSHASAPRPQGRGVRVSGA